MFSGVIPQSLANLKALTTTMDSEGDNNPFEEVYDSAYWSGDMGMSGDSLSLPTKGQVLDYTGNILFFKSIDLSCNRLVGQIPKEIGALLGLINLYHQTYWVETFHLKSAMCIHWSLLTCRTTNFMVKFLSP